MIKRRRDVPRFIKSFTSIAEYDGAKYFMVLGDTTLMRYDDGSYTYHRKNEMYWDWCEHPVQPEELLEFVWSYRKEINKIEQIKTAHKEAHKMPTIG